MKRVLNKEFENTFEEHILKTFGVIEIAEYYKVKLDKAQKMDVLYVKLTKANVKSCFYYAIYYANWIRSEVGESRQLFSAHSRNIEYVIA